MSSISDRSREFFRKKVLLRDAERYVWWLGNQSRYIRIGLAATGWRLSQFGYRVLGRPRGALTWPLGLTLLPLNATNKTTVEYSNYVARYFNGLVDSSGVKLLANESVDVGGVGYAALRMYEITGDTKYLHFSTVLAQIYINMPGANDGLISYSIGKSEILVDTLAFLCPFLARMTRLTGNPAYSRIAIVQLEAMWQRGHGLDSWIFHGFDKKDFSLLGISGWGRGVGWLLIGMIDVALELSPNVERAIWLARAETLLVKLSYLQLDSGHFPWRFDLPDSGIDSSVTSLVAYSIARLIQAEIPIGNSLINVLKRCREGINAVTDELGHVMNCSGEALGLGRYSYEFGCYIWGQAPAVAVDCILQDYSY